ncbi:hypothetical protein ACROYT_G010530 [Oculina patagonica]
MENRYGLVPRRLSCSRFVGERKSRRLRRRQGQKMSILPPQKGLGIPGDGRGLKGQNVAEQENTWFTTSQVHKN